MRVVHLMQREKFTKPVAGFYNKFFLNGEHEILYISAPGTQPQFDGALKIRQREVFLDLKNKAETIGLIRRLAIEYDYIIMHSLFYPVTAFLANPQALKKLVWIAWGYDLYNEKKLTGVKKIISDVMYRTVKSHCSVFIGIFPPDCEFYKEKFPKSRARIYYAPYISVRKQAGFETYSPECSLDQRKQDGEPVYIQVGHSAAEVMNHKSALDRIAKYKDENIRILLPLSYGDMAYGDQVQKYAYDIFGDKAICLREFMPVEEYNKILSRVDIGIFETYRQIALGNINTMIFQNKKIYLPEESVMYRYFHSRGVPVQPVEELDTFTFDALSRRVDSHDPEAFREYMEEYTNNEGKIDRWRTIYEELRKGLK